MDATTRRATADDVPAITTLVAAAYGKWVPVIGREPLPMTVDYALAVQAHRIDLLFVGPDLAALIETADAGDALLIVNVAVSPSYQKRGYGRRLIADAERFARESGTKHLRLYTNAKFDENLQLYRSLGFEDDRRERNDRGVIVHMRKAIG